MRFFSDFFCKIVSKCLGKVSSCAKNQEDMVDDVSTKKVHTARIFGWFFKSTGTFIPYSRVINLQVENFHFIPINNLGVTLGLHLGTVANQLKTAFLAFIGYPKRDIE